MSARNRLWSFHIIPKADDDDDDEDYDDDDDDDEDDILHWTRHELDTNGIEPTSQRQHIWIKDIS